jgi:hypothetical protein
MPNIFAANFLFASGMNFQTIGNLMQAVAFVLQSLIFPYSKSQSRKATL